jgi:hypothetical protein
MPSKEEWNRKQTVPVGKTIYQKWSEIQSFSVPNLRSVNKFAKSWRWRKVYGYTDTVIVTEITRIDSCFAENALGVLGMEM